MRLQLLPLIDLLDVDSDPHQILALLHRTGWAELLGQLADEHEEITHDLLDHLQQRQHVHYLRQVLINAGILPERDGHLDTVPSWLAEFLEGKPAHHTRLLRPYAAWSVLCRARRRALRRPAVHSAAKHARARILIAARFLSWIDNNGLTLATVRQQHVDVWLTGGTTTHYRLRDFLKWARARDLVGDVTVPWLRREQPEHFLPPDSRWSLLRACLSDLTVPITLRAAGLLVLLYALVPSRIVKLTPSHITRDGQRTFLTLDRQPVLLPPRVADLVHELAEHEPDRRQPVSEKPDAPRKWLFPGSTPGGHADAGRLTQHLHDRLGIVIRPARNSALSEMAADLPAPVVADLLGVHITTASRWVGLFKRDWSGYVAARLHDDAVTKT